MKYVVASTAVVDEIRFSDGSVKENVPGGAGIYALSGIKIWCDDVGIVTGVGRDYFEKYNDWYEKNELTTTGLIVKDDYTPHTTVQYFEDGERIETPKFGLEHYQKIEATPSDVEKYCNNAKGVYVFKNANKYFWNEMLKIKHKKGFKLMWEIGADATIPENCELIKTIAKQIDIFSINKTEVLTMLNVENLEEAIDIIRGWNIPLIYLRNGKEGAYMIAESKVFRVPSVKNVQVVDATGGGNSSSGAVLYGFCEGYDPITTGIMGSISASYCISQFGVPPIIDDDLRKQAINMKDQMYKEVNGGN